MKNKQFYFNILFFFVFLMVLLPCTFAFAEPDLVMTDVIPSVTSVPVGGDFTVSNTVFNQGSTQTTTSFSIGIYLSTDSTVTTSDVRIGGWTSGILATGTSSGNNTSVGISSTQDIGTYYIGTIADYADNIPETDETNNSLVSITTVTVVMRDIDLVMTDVIPSVTSVTSVPAGGSFTVSNTVLNQGSTQTTTSFSIGIYLSTDNTITTSDVLIGSWTSGILANGTSSDNNTSVGISSTQDIGTYYIGAIADYANNIPETDETNNSLTSSTTVTVVIRDIDLVMTDVVPSVTSVLTGDGFTVSNTMMNQGSTQTNAPLYIGVYLSDDNTITTGDTLIGSWNNSCCLGAGASLSNDTSVGISYSQAPGTYYIGAIADYNNNIPETDENNNTLVSATTVEVVGDIDLIMTSVHSVSDLSAYRRQFYSI